MALADDFKIPVKCANCGNEIPKSLRELHLGDIIECPCGTKIEVTGDDPQEAVAGLDGINDAFKRLQDTAKKRW